MIYRTNPKNGDKLSELGYGVMRLPRNLEEAEKLVFHAIENGVNYFDTAYIYPNNEEMLGRILAKGYRDKVKIATKVQPYLIKEYQDFDKIFNIELKRLQTDYIDYYLIHMLTDIKVWNRLVDIGVKKWIAEKKENGQIINIGFSYHGGKSDFTEIIDSYDWGFCMIQYNFLDENNQAGRSGLEYAASKGLAVMVMEPLRGGKLAARLPKEVYDIWNNAYIKRTPAEWAFRWIWNHPGVTVVLSGMSTKEMLDENLETASNAEANSFPEKDFELFEKVKTILQEKIKIPCTACNYCMPCPHGVDIPTCFSCYNDREIEGAIMSRGRYLMRTSMRKEMHNASLCTKCGLCEIRCPQKIAIRDELVKVKKSLEGFYYKPVMFFVKRFMKL
ncbi:MAG: aldo/keto reductase [Oscillospiraceae bacterium]|nr:aldo/keto reductase [Oscillospiraceae bacterium]